MKGSLIVSLLLFFQARDVGYNSPWHYLLGQSRFNSSVYGWAGHTSEGGVVSNVSGGKNIKLGFKRKLLLLIVLQM